MPLQYLKFFFFKALLFSKVIFGHIDHGLFGTIGTDAMGKFDLGMSINISLQSIPIVVVVPDLFTGCANRQQVGKHSYFSVGLLQFGTQMIGFNMDFLSFFDFRSNLQLCQLNGFMLSPQPSLDIGYYPT